MSEPSQLDSELEKHLIEHLGFLGKETEDPELGSRVALDTLIEGSKFAIDSVNNGMGSAIVPGTGGAPAVGPNGTAWTAEKFVHDMKLDKFLKEN